MKTVQSEFGRPAASAEELSAALASARALFGDGRLNDAADRLARVDAAAAAAIGAAARRDFLVFGLACFGVGDPDEARARHEAAPPERDAALRYRMLIAMKDFAAARRHRKRMEHPRRTAVDFRWTLSREALWSGRVGRGLRLYGARVEAEHFSRILPGWLRHDPRMADDPAPAAVALEQGLGDILFHIAQMQKLGVRPRLVFGLARHRRLIAAVWPEAAFRDFADGPGEHEGLAVACSADWLLRRWRRDGGLGGIAPINGLAASGPRAGIGVCWRGGSGQNRREEREIPLQFFLDLLPRASTGGAGYVALQHDLTDAERAMLASRPDIAPADLDLRSDDYALARAVGRLEGVITVDSANAHLAGLVGTPLLLLMNRRAHWYWGPRARAGDAYAGAETAAMATLSRGKISGWIRGRLSGPARRPTFRRAAGGPVFVTGAPRSRTSMIAGALAAGGLRLGETVGPTPDNHSGFAENRRIRETVLKPLLKGAGFDPLGVRSLPPTDWNPPAPGLRDAVAAALTEANGTEARWGYKDPKLLLVWRRWAAAFPEATWILVDRTPEAVADSCRRTGFMRRHAAHGDFWRHFARSYAMRADELAEWLGEAVIRIDSDLVAAARAFPIDLRERLAALGVDVDAAETFLRETSLTAADEQGVDEQDADES